MHRSALPVTAAALALAWCTAQLVSSGWLAAAVCVLSIPAACLPALARRPGRAATTAVLGGMAAALAALIFPLLLGVTGASALALQLGFVVLLTPLAPLAYALTFPDDDGSK